jgi:hypothetical protein
VHVAVVVSLEREDVGLVGAAVAVGSVVVVAAAAVERIREEVQISFGLADIPVVPVHAGVGVVADG